MTTRALTDSEISLFVSILRAGGKFRGALLLLTGIGNPHERQRRPHSAVAVRVTGKNEHLELGRQSAQYIEDALLPDRVGVDQDVVEDEHLRLVDSQL